MTMPYIPPRYHRPLLAFTTWIFTLIIIGFSLSLSFFTPSYRPFSPTDPTISYPYQTNAAVPTWLLFLISTVIPAFIIALRIALYPALPFTTNGWKSVPIKTRLVWLHQSWLGLAASLAVSLLLVDGLKNLLGKPRPDFLSRCGLVEGWEDGDYYIGPTKLLITVKACTAPYGKRELKDGFRAFPSGHAALSFTGMGYLAGWLRRWFFPVQVTQRGGLVGSGNSSAGSGSEMGLESPRLGDLEGATRNLPRAKPASQKGFFGWVLLLLPLSLAAWCSATRYSDFRHAGFDILAGVVIGCFGAALGWKVVGKRAGRGGWRAVVTEGRIGFERDEGKRSDDHVVVDKSREVLDEPQVINEDMGANTLRGTR